MRARASILLVLPLLLAPAAAAETARFVPGLVLDGTVPAYVAGLAAGHQVTLTIGETSVTKAAAAAGSVLVKLAGVAPGLHEWTLGVFDGNVTTTTRGFVLVDTELADLRAAVALQQDAEGEELANLTKELRTFEKALEARQNRTLGNLTAKLDALPLLAIRNATAALAVQPPAAPPVTVVAASAAPSGWAAAAPAGLLALLLLPVHAVTFLHARKGRREAMMMLLVLAAKAGITPESPEFQKAMEAFEGKPKKKRKGADEAAPVGA